MISNLRQARIAIKKIEQLERELARAGDAGKNLHPRIRRAIREGIQAQLNELREDVDQFERVRERKQTSWQMIGLEDIPKILIMARVAQGITQAQLAERLNLKEQQIQRYEATCYSSASLKRIMRVADALGIEFHDDEVHLLPSRQQPAPPRAKA